MPEFDPQTGAQVGQILTQALGRIAQMRQDAQQFAVQMGVQARRQQFDIYADLFNRGLINKAIFTQKLGLPPDAVPEIAPDVARIGALREQAEAETGATKARRVATETSTALEIEEKQEISPADRPLLASAIATGDGAVVQQILARSGQADKLARLRAILDKDAMERTGKPASEDVVNDAILAEFRIETDPTTAAEQRQLALRLNRAKVREAEADSQRAEVLLDTAKRADELKPQQRASLLLDYSELLRKQEEDPKHANLQQLKVDRQELDSLRRKQAKDGKLTRPQQDRLSVLEFRERSPLNPLPDALTITELLDKARRQDVIMGAIENALGISTEVPGGEQGGEGEAIVSGIEGSTGKIAPSGEPDVNVLLGRASETGEIPSDAEITAIARSVGVSEKRVRDRFTAAAGPAQQAATSEAEIAARRDTLARAKRKLEFGVPRSELTAEERKLLDAEAENIRLRTHAARTIPPAPPARR